MKEYWHGNLEPFDKEEAGTSEERVKDRYCIHLTTKYGPVLSSDIRRTLMITEPDTASWEIFDDQSKCCNVLCRPYMLDKWRYKERLFELIYYPFPGEHRLIVEGIDSSANYSYETFKRRKIHQTATVAFLCFLVFIVCILAEVQVKYKGVLGGLVLGFATAFAAISLFALFLAVGLSFPKPWRGGEIRNLQLEKSRTKGEGNDRATVANAAATVKSEPELQQENFGFEGDTTQKIVVAEINSKSGSNAGMTGICHDGDAGTSHASVLGQSRETQENKNSETGKRKNKSRKIRLPPVEQKGRDSLLRLQKLQQQQE